MSREGTFHNKNLGTSQVQGNFEWFFGYLKFTFCHGIFVKKKLYCDLQDSSLNERSFHYCKITLQTLEIQNIDETTCVDSKLEDVVQKFYLPFR